MHSDDVFDRLMDQIHLRAKTKPAGSYTTKLIEGGVGLMGAKITEEASEVVQAARALQSKTVGSQVTTDCPLRNHLIYEAGDVIYHLWVLLGSFGITVDQLRRELERREGTSGLEEKRRRNEKE